MKHLLYIFLFFYSSTHAQHWCQPGATWHFHNQSLQMNSYKSGVTELKYIDTVTVNNILCKKLVGTFIGVTPFSASPVTTITSLYFKTYENNKVYYLYDSTFNTFDTLANFNALIGDSWRVPEFPSDNSVLCQFTRPIVTVIDTGHILLNSIYLKKVIVKNNLTNEIDTIIEKIAGFNHFLTPTYACITDVPDHGKLMCYIDNGFSVIKKAGYVNCFYDPTEVPENNKSNTTFKVYPNPFRNTTTASFYVSDIHLTSVNLYDIMGKELTVTYCSDLKPGYNKIEIKNISQGIYFLKLQQREIISTIKLVAIE